MTVVEFSAPVETPVEVLTEREQRARTLEAAALEIEYRGATHSSIEDKHGRVCLVGAILAAQGMDMNYDPYQRAGQVWEPGQFAACMMASTAGTHDAALTSPYYDYDPAFVLRWRAEEIRDGR